MSDSLLLERARQAKVSSDNEKELIGQLPELEAQAAKEAQAILHEEKKQQAQEMFDTALEAHKARSDVDTANYVELRRVFRSYIVQSKIDNRSYQNVVNASLSLGYFLASEDKMFGLSRESQNAHSQQLLIDAGIKQLELPLKVDVLDDIFQTMIEEGLKTA